MPWSCGSRWSRGTAGSPWAVSALRISLATVLRQHATFWAISSAYTLGAPYDSRLAWWIVLIPAVRSTRRFWRSLGPRCRAACTRCTDPQRLAQGQRAVLASIVLDEGVGLLLNAA
jgi:hypothetical protein